MYELTDYMTSDEKEYYEALLDVQASQGKELVSEGTITEQASSAPSPVQAR